MGDYLSECVLTGKGWDAPVEAILDDLVLRCDGGDVVEIGANIGASIIPIANKYPSLHFHCVEPIPDFFELLEANAGSYDVKNVTLYNNAVAATNGKKIEIHTQMGTAGALRSYDNHVPVGVEQLRAVTLDSLFAERDVKLIKLDVDGFELEVLRGAALTFKRCEPMCFMEFHTKIMRQLEIDPHEICSFFSDLGYEQVTVYENGAVISRTNSFAELVRIADSVQYYVDVLIEK
jgi:FkbM family methyltransferase